MGSPVTSLRRLVLDERSPIDEVEEDGEAGQQADCRLQDDHERSPIGFRNVTVAEPPAPTGIRTRLLHQGVPVKGVIGNGSGSDGYPA